MHKGEIAIEKLAIIVMAMIAAAALIAVWTHNLPVPDQAFGLKP